MFEDIVLRIWEAITLFFRDVPFCQFCIFLHCSKNLWPPPFCTMLKIRQNSWTKQVREIKRNLILNFVTFVFILVFWKHTPLSILIFLKRYTTVHFNLRTIKVFWQAGCYRQVLPLPDNICQFGFFLLFFDIYIFLYFGYFTVSDQPEYCSIFHFPTVRHRRDIPTFLENLLANFWSCLYFVDMF